MAPPFPKPPALAGQQNPAGLVVDPAGTIALLFSTMMIYGPTGVRKTTQIGEFAKFIYEKTGKKTRLLATDGGGWGPIQNYVDAGIIDVWRLVDEENPLAAITKGAKGAWPTALRNGIRTGDIKEVVRADRAKALADVGAYAVDGITSMAQMVIGSTVSKGQKISQDIVGKFEEGGETFGAASPSHYGFAQRMVVDNLIRPLSGLPLERVLYTALEGKGEDRLTKTTTYGPAVAGQAITSVIPTYVGDCLHFDDYLADAGVVKVDDKDMKLVSGEVRVWFTQHPDPITKIMWPAKPRVVADRYAEFKKRLGEHGFFNLTGDKNLYNYLKVQEEMLQASGNELKLWKEAMDLARAGKGKE